jgi:hypothetical protein
MKITAKLMSLKELCSHVVINNIYDYKPSHGCSHIFIYISV